MAEVPSREVPTSYYQGRDQARSFRDRESTLEAPGKQLPPKRDKGLGMGLLLLTELKTMYLNKVILIGNLTRDPELKALPSGIKVVNFALATNRVWKDKVKGKQEEVTFHNIVGFGQTAENVAQYMKKGSSILIEGRIVTRSWEKDGEKKYKTEVVMESCQFGPKSSSAGESRAEREDRGVDTDEKKKTLDEEFPDDEDIDPADIPF